MQQNTGGVVRESGGSYAIAAAAMMTALVAVVSALFQIPDIAVVFAAIVFGPWVRAGVRGLGSAIGDIISGLAPFAPIAFVASAGEGLIVGAVLIYRPRWLVFAGLAGVAWMLVTYLIGETLLFGWGAALTDLAINGPPQAGAAALAIPLYTAVRAAYPPIAQLRLRRTWREL